MSINFLDVRKILPRNVAFQLCRKKELHKLPVFLHPITVAQHVTRHQCTTKHHPHDAGVGLLQEEAGEEEEEELSWVTWKNWPPPWFFPYVYLVETPKKDMKTYLFVAWFNSHKQPAQKLEFINNASGMIPMISPLDGEKYLVNSDGYIIVVFIGYKPTTMGDYDGYDTGWWWLEHGWIMTFHILGISSSQLTNSIIFQRGRYTTNQDIFIVSSALDTVTSRPISFIIDVATMKSWKKTLNPSWDLSSLIDIDD